jgi:hypothetical protein
MPMMQHIFIIATKITTDLATFGIEF